MSDRSQKPLAIQTFLKGETSPKTYCSVRHLPSNDYSQNSDEKELWDCLYQHAARRLPVWGLWLLVTESCDSNWGDLSSLCLGMKELQAAAVRKSEKYKAYRSEKQLVLKNGVTHKHTWVPLLRCVHMKHTHTLTLRCSELDHQNRD